MIDKHADFSDVLNIFALAKQIKFSWAISGWRIYRGWKKKRYRLHYTIYGFIKNMFE